MANALEALADADLRLEWAEKHIANFEREIRIFHERHSYGMRPHHDPKWGHMVQLVNPPEIPPQLNLIASDAVHSIRVSLDYLACALAVLNGKSMSNVYFPIAVSIDEYGNPETQRKIKKLSPDARAFIDGLKPYKGGNDLLWAINEIEKVDKHRNLVLLNEAAPMFYRSTHAGHDDEASNPASETRQYNFKVALVPGFANLEGFEGQAALTLLKEFLGSVADVLREARRLFFAGTERNVVLGPSLPI